VSQNKEILELREQVKALQTEPARLREQLSGLQEENNSLRLRLRTAELTSIPPPSAQDVEFYNVPVTVRDSDIPRGKSNTPSKQTSKVLLYHDLVFKSLFYF
jgi:hypothetical protein